MFAVFATILTFALRSSNTLGVFRMVVHTSPGVFLGAYAVVPPGEADLWFPVFVFALAFIVVL